MSFQLDNQQSQVLNDSINSDSWDIMIIKGIAGSGKTTILGKIFDKYSESMNIYSLFPSAFTGRAAAVLRDKGLNNAKTIHHRIWGRRTMYKPFDSFNAPTIMKDDRSNNELWIIDEGSMIEEYLLFWLLVEIHIPEKINKIFEKDEKGNFKRNKNGKEKKLNVKKGKLDMLINDPDIEFKINPNKKIIFCGDINQLRPFFTKGYKQHALSLESLNKLGFKLNEYELKTMYRHFESEDIHKAAKDIEEKPTILEQSNYDSNNVFIVENNNFENICHLYLEHKEELENTKYITFNNQTAHEFNIAIRPFIHKDVNFSTNLIVGDLIHVTKNNYYHELWNGDFLKVLNILEEKQGSKLHVKAIEDINEKTIKVDSEVSINFMKVEVLHIETQKIHKLWIIADTLNNSENPETERWIYSDRDEMYFVYEQYLNEFYKHRNRFSKDDSKETKKFDYENDEYNNALFVNYSYAITGHKSQGGEWDNVFVDLTYVEKVKNENNNTIKYQVVNGNKQSEGWRYTAITRASKKVFIIPPRETLILT